MRASAHEMKLGVAPVGSRGPGQADPQISTLPQDQRLAWIKPEIEIIETGMEVTAYLASD